MKISLRNKIQLMVFLIVASSSIFLYLFFNDHQKEIIRGSFEQSTSSFATVIALGIQASLEVGDFEAMERAVNFARSDPEMLFIAVLDESGNAIATYPSDYVYGEEDKEQWKDDVFTVSAAYEAEDFLGKVVIGRSTEAYENSLVEAQLFVALVSALTLFFGGIASFWFAGSIAGPILKIKEAADWLGQGDLGYRVNIDSNDELGELAASFNQMASDVQRYLDAAQEATRAKGEFLASMSHEIRTPMNGVIGMTSLLTETSLDQEQREYVETIRHSGDSLLTIINDILDFSKIEAGQMELEEHNFEIRTCIEDAIDVLAFKAAQKGLELGCLVMPDVPHVVAGDSTRIRQIVVNLVGNGIKFTEEGEVTVTVEAGEVLASGKQQLLLIVRDTGIGIPEAKKEKLFQSFSQVDASTTRKYGGTGLGLAISRRLTELMEGEIWVESEYGEGSAFYVSMLVRPVEAHVFQRDAALEAKKVLVVDDNATNRKILELQLSSWGMEVITATTGPEALKLLPSIDPVDLFVLDYQMPLMDGITLGRLLLKNQAHACPILMLSSLGTKVDFASHTLFVSLHKPIREAHLKQTILKMLTESSAPAGPAIDAVNYEGAGSILIADDNVINQKVLIRLLQQLGLQADVAANGEEVIRAMEARQYNIILMDVQMPVMDGVNASKWIRSNIAQSRQPYIIAVSANIEDEDGAAFAESGIDDVIAKPIKLEELRNAIAHTTSFAEASVNESQLS